MAKPGIPVSWFWVSYCLFSFKPLHWLLLPYSLLNLGEPSTFDKVSTKILMLSPKIFIYNVDVIPIINPVWRLKRWLQFMHVAWRSFASMLVLLFVENLTSLYNFPLLVSLEFYFRQQTEVAKVLLITSTQTAGCR